MRSYRLYIATPVLIMFIVVMVGVPIAALVLAVGAASGKLSGPPWQFLLFFSVIAVFFSCMQLRTPFEITTRDDGMIEFRSIWGRTCVSPNDIISVKARRSQIGFVEVKCREKTIPLISQIDGFHEFLTTLKSLNPSVEIKGC